MGRSPDPTIAYEFCKNKCHEEERLYGNGTVYNNSEYIVKLDQNI